MANSLLHILLPPENASWLAIGMIALLALLAVRQLRRVSRQLGEEVILLARCREAVQDAAQQRLPIMQADIDRWLRAVEEKSVIARGIRSVWAARFINNPDLEAIGSMLGQSEMMRLSFARSAPNLLLLAGLFGTVIGLAGMVGTLGPQIEGTLRTADPLVLTRNLGATLQQMQSAFACTLWGILAAISMALSTRRIASRQEELLAQLQEFGIREFAPAIFPRTQAAQLEDVQQVLLQSRQFLQQVAVIMEASAQRFETVLTGAGETMAQSMQQLQGMATGMQSSLQEVAGDVRFSAEALGKSSREVQQSAEALQEYHQDLRNAYTTLRQLFDESQERIAAMSTEQLTHIDSMQTEFGDSTNRILGQLQQTSGDIAEAIHAFTHAGEEFANVGLANGSSLGQGFSRMREELSTILSEHRSAMGHVEDGVRLIADRLAALSERLDPRMLPEGEWQAVREALTICTAEMQQLTLASGHPHYEESVGRITMPGMLTHAASHPESSADLLRELQAIRQALGLIHLAVTPEPRRYFLGIPLPGRWFGVGRE